MKDIKVYDIVIDLLQEHPRFRDSDKLLIWGVWHRMGLTQQIGDHMTISFQSFIEAPTPETITRCRRKIQETHPELQATAEVAVAREDKAHTKGTFIYQERMKI